MGLPLFSGPNYGMDFPLKEVIDGEPLYHFNADSSALLLYPALLKKLTGILHKSYLFLNVHTFMQT